MDECTQKRMALGPDEEVWRAVLTAEGAKRRAVRLPLPGSATWDTACRGLREVRAKREVEGHSDN